MTEDNLKHEYSFLLAALADYVHERSSAVPGDVDLPALVALANAQQVAGIVYCQTKVPELQTAFAAASFYAVNRGKLQEKIDGAFRQAKLPYLVFKGTEAAQYYPHPKLRTSGDIDILVQAEDKERAGEILEELGFACGSKGGDHEWCYSKGNFEIELHHRLLYDDDMNEAALTTFTDTAWEHAASEDGVLFHLEPEFHFVYLLLHLRKHFLWAGIGIRQFLDLALMAKNGGLDWGKVEVYITSCEAEKFASVCFGLLGRWFGVEVPGADSELTEEFCVRAAETILSGSVFGDMSEENIVENALANTKIKQGRLRSGLRVVFPPYEQMKRKYPGMCGKDALGRLLLPVMWLRRFAEAVGKNSVGSGMTYAGKYVTEKDARSQELKAWGLWK